MPSQHYHFNITMTCGGCSGAVDRVLKRLDGIEKYDVSLESKTADVYTKDGVDLPFETVLEKIKKTGKTVNSAEVDGVAHAV